jgi:hypothetical protein
VAEEIEILDEIAKELDKGDQKPQKWIRLNNAVILYAP